MKGTAFAAELHDGAAASASLARLLPRDSFLARAPAASAIVVSASATFVGTALAIVNSVATAYAAAAVAVESAASTHLEAVMAGLGSPPSCARFAAMRAARRRRRAVP